MRRPTGKLIYQAVRCHGPITSARARLARLGLVRFSGRVEVSHADGRCRKLWEAVRKGP